jgi:molybdopterin synthase catalytic subunit
MAIRLQREDFDVGAEIAALTSATPRIGAVVSFIGLVRDLHVREGYHRDAVQAMTLEHWPGVTEKALADIDAEAHRRWPLDASLIVHRYGRLEPGERIVLVLTASPHRDAAFDACRFLIDWKLEETPHGEHWVDAHADDDAAARRWEKG